MIDQLLAKITAAADAARERVSGIGPGGREELEKFARDLIQPYQRKLEENALENARLQQQVNARDTVISDKDAKIALLKKLLGEVCPECAGSLRKLCIACGEVGYFTTCPNCGSNEMEYVA